MSVTITTALDSGSGILCDEEGDNDGGGGRSSVKDFEPILLSLRTALKTLRRGFKILNDRLWPSPTWKIDVGLSLLLSENKTRGLGRNGG